MEKHKTHKKQLRISHQTRKELIRLVTCEKMTVKFAHLQLGINYSTAKMIVRKYKQSGKITQFRRERSNSYSQNINSNSADQYSSQNKDCFEKIENNNQNGGEQNVDCRFQNLGFSNYDQFQVFDFNNFGTQFLCLPTVLMGYAVHNYFNF